jgi:hypothetical protein
MACSGIDPGFPLSRFVTDYKMLAEHCILVLKTACKHIKEKMRKVRILALHWVSAFPFLSYLTELHLSYQNASLIYRQSVLVCGILHY